MCPEQLTELELQQCKLYENIIYMPHIWYSGEQRCIVDCWYGRLHKRNLYLNDMEALIRTL